MIAVGDVVLYRITTDDLEGYSRTLMVGNRSGGVWNGPPASTTCPAIVTEVVDGTRASLHALMPGAQMLFWAPGRRAGTAEGQWVRR